MGIGANVAAFHQAAASVGDALEAKNRSLFTATVAILLLTILAVMTIASVLARHISEPIRRLTDAVRAVELGDFESGHLTSLQIRAKDEIGLLASGFGKVIARLQETLKGLEQELVERRRAEAALRDSETRYRGLFDGVPVGLYRTTPAGRFLDANLALVQTVGYPSREDLLAANAGDLYVDAEQRARWTDLMEREGEVTDFELLIRRYDGSIVWLNDRARAVRDGSGRALHYEGSLEDITQRKDAEAELRQYQEALEELVRERTAELERAVSEAQEARVGAASMPSLSLW